MGYILTAIAADLGKVSGAVGSRNKELFGDLLDMFGNGFGQFDEMATDYADEDDGEKPLTMREALTQMVMGEAYNKQFGFMYGYALEFICRYFGEFLPNGEWSAMPSGSGWAETVDRGLAVAGVPESVLRVGRHLMNRGSPIAIPEIQDFPGIGYLKLEEIESALRSLENAKLTAIEDNYVVTSIQEVHSWLQTCANSNCDLVCFYA
jgi:hypothetical protein